MFLGEPIHHLQCYTFLCDHRAFLLGNVGSWGTPFELTLQKWLLVHECFHTVITDMSFRQTAETIHTLLPAPPPIS